MKLYEVSDGWTGESYCRFYVYVASEKELKKELASREDGRRVFSYTLMIDTESNKEPFVTNTSSSGWVECTKDS